MMKTFRFAVILLLLAVSSSIACAEIRVSADEAMKAAVNRPQPEYNPVARQFTANGDPTKAVASLNFDFKL